jgi:hypothetical protein
LFFGEALAADGDALPAQHRGDTGLGDAVAGTNLLGRLARVVPLHDLVGIFSGQAALRTGWWAVIA